MQRKKAKVFRTNFYYGGKLLAYDTIEIMNEKITMYRKKYFFGAFFSVSIPLENVVHVDVCKRVRGAEILIESYTKNHIVSKGYSLADAIKLKEMILP